MKIQTRKVYVSEDDKSFDTEIECKAHEDNIFKQKLRLKNIKFYNVVHSPDLTEGSGHYGLTYIAIEDSYYHENYLRDFCFTKYSFAIQFVQGCAPIEGWRYTEIDLDEYLKWPEKYIRVGDPSYRAKAYFLSDVGDYSNLPIAISKKYCQQRFEEKGK